MSLTALARAADELSELPESAIRAAAKLRQAEITPQRVLGGVERFASLYSGLRDAGAGRQEAVTQALDTIWEDFTA